MKSLIVALMLAAAPAQADILRWDDEDCGATVTTEDNRHFTWVGDALSTDHAGGINTQCHIAATRDNVALLVCKNGMTPTLIMSDGHIQWDGVEMWMPESPKNSPDCTCTGDDCGDM